MKHFFFLSSLILAGGSVIFSSCSSDDLFSVKEDVKRIEASLCDFAMEDGATRTSYTLGGNGYEAVWAEGDILGIYPLGGDQVAFPISDGVGTTLAKFDGGAWALRGTYQYAAYYPFSSGNYTISETAIPVCYLGQTQTANNSVTHFAEYDFMAAAATNPDASGSVTLPFKHLSSYLILPLTLPKAGTYTQLTLTSSNGEFITKGTVDLSAPTPTIAATETSASISMDLDNIVLTPENLVLTANLLIAPVDLTGSTITITVTDSDGATYTNKEKAWTRSAAFVANTTYKASRTLAGSGTGGEIEGGGGMEEDNGDTPAYQYVDLGLSVMWATFNIGATKPEEYGDYFAWGATEPLYEAGYAQENPQQHWKDGKADGYTWVNTPYQTVKDAYQASNPMWTKYLGCTTFDWYMDPSASEEDALKAILDPEDDAAHVNWGDKWRMPTKEEQDELRNNCTWTWTTLNGVNGYKVQSKKPGYTDNWIFLPAAGMRVGTNLDAVGEEGDYRSCSLDLNHYNDAKNAYYIFFLQDRVECTSPDRTYGFSIRPVYSSDDPAAGITGITLNKSSLSMHPDDTETLVATVSKIAGAVVSDQVVWYSSNENIAVVTTSGKVYAFQPGTATITARTVFGGFEASCTVTVQSIHNGHEYVDLGLPSGLKWATCNVGANAPEEYGDYFAWGETEPYYSSLNPLTWKSGKSAGYDWGSYSLCNGSAQTITKYTHADGSTISSWYSNGTFIGDNKGTLDPEDDAAHVNWGGNWRMPTSEEIQELIDNCTCYVMYSDGKYYSKFKSNKPGYTDKYIIFPYAGAFFGTSRQYVNGNGGRAYCWSSSKSTSFSSNSDLAYYLYTTNGIGRCSSSHRIDGNTVRAVCP